MAVGGVSDIIGSVMVGAEANLCRVILAGRMKWRCLRPKGRSCLPKIGIHLGKVLDLIDVPGTRRIDLTVNPEVLNEPECIKRLHCTQSRNSRDTRSTHVAHPASQVHPPRSQARAPYAIGNSQHMTERVALNGSKPQIEAGTVFYC